MALGLSAVLLTVLAAAWAVTGDGDRDGKDNCEHAIVARVPSPDGAWEARIDEATCLFGFGTGAVVAGAHLVSTRDPARSADLLGVQTGGHKDERPSLA